jgi:hypothetical protein
MVRARQKPAVWWLEGNNVIPAMVDPSPPKQSQNHEQRARRQSKSKSHPDSCSVSLHPQQQHL